MIFRITNVNRWLLCALFFLGGLVADGRLLMATETELQSTAEIPFDGSWKGKLFTRIGNCRKIYSFRRLTVRDGQILGELHGNRGTYKLTGTVKNDGTTEMILTGGTSVELTGTFEIAKAEGRWESESGCKGTFKFKRKKK